MKAIKREIEMLLVGLTGGIATGKSTTSRILRERYGAPIVDADVIAREVVEPGTSAYKKIVARFAKDSPDLLLEDGSLNRPVLGRLVFGPENEAARKDLNSIVHPAVRWEMARQVLVAWAVGHRMVILDVPLLFESKLDRFVGTSMAVVCSEEVELERLLARDSFLDKDDAEKRIASQMSLDEKRRLADHVIENNGGLEELEGQIDAVIRKIRPSAAWTFIEWVLPPVGLLSALYYFVMRNYYQPKAKL